MLWSSDDACLARLEMREDLELGFDRHNEQTFGEDFSMWSIELQFRANALLQCSGLDKWDLQKAWPTLSASRSGNPRPKMRRWQQKNSKGDGPLKHVGRSTCGEIRLHY